MIRIKIEEETTPTAIRETNNSITLVETLLPQLPTKSPCLHFS